VWVIAGVDVTKLNDFTYRELGVIVDARPSSENQPTGTYCSLGRHTDGSDYIDMYLRDRDATTNSDVPITSATPDFPVDELRPGKVVAFHQHAGSPDLVCRFSNGAIETGIAGSPGTLDPVPVAGTVGLFGTAVDADFAYLFVVGRVP
jgi:hypothetical protein